MFGYVRPEAGELKVKEHNTYKALYCGLCKCTGKCVSCSARFTLSYDFVFLALLRMALTGESPSFEKGRCMAHPLKSRAYALPCEALSYSAKASALLTYYKLEDDIADTKGARRIAYKMALPHAKRIRKKADGLEGLEEKMRSHLQSLSGIEARREPSADAPAEVFGRLLEDVGAHGLDGVAARIGGQVCFHVGKWIYFADALDDYLGDVKSGSYNPLITAYPEDGDAARQTLLCAMANERSRALDALALADIKDGGVRNILENILTHGMMSVENKLLKTEKDND